MPNNLSVSEKNQIDVAATEALLTGNVEKIFEAVASIKQKGMEEERERIAEAVSRMTDKYQRWERGDMFDPKYIVGYAVAVREIQALSNQQSQEENNG